MFYRHAILQRTNYIIRIEKARNSCIHVFQKFCIHHLHLYINHFCIFVIVSVDRASTFAHLGDVVGSVGCRSSSEMKGYFPSVTKLTEYFTTHVIGNIYLYTFKDRNAKISKVLEGRTE